MAEPTRPRGESRPAPARGMAEDARQVLAVAGKDLRSEVRSRAVTVATVFFAGTTLVILAFAVGSDADILGGLAPGALWVALAFAGVISASQSYAAEGEEGAYEQLLLYPVPRAAIYLGKLLANWLYMVLLAALMLPLAAVLFGMPIARPGWGLLATVALGTLGFALIATFYAALTANLRARESLLPVLMFPVVVPILLASVRATTALTHLADPALASDWLQLLLGFDLVYLVVCTAAFPYLVDE